MTDEIRLLSAMITPAVLISACGTLILSNSLRLGRIVDRGRELSRLLEELCTDARSNLTDERRRELERQLATHAQRSRLIQRSLTCFYLALGFFVATTVSIGAVAIVRYAVWLSSLLGIIGTVVLFYGCMVLIAETRLALRSVDEEMRYVLRLSERHDTRGVTTHTNHHEELPATIE
jgi:hypothetical protein